MKLGILGGTFNPVHTGHLILAENAYDQLGLDEVCFIPSGVSYLKDTSVIAPAKDRLAMVSLAIEGNPHFSLSTIETDREGDSYTYETLMELKEKDPSCELFFICGADILMSIGTWKKPEKIFELCELVVAPRDEKSITELKEKVSELEKTYDARIRLLHTTDLAISSRMLRERLKDNKSVRYYLPEKVMGYIKEHKLYI